MFQIFLEDCCVEIPFSQEYETFITKFGKSTLYGFGDTLYISFLDVVLANSFSEQSPYFYFFQFLDKNQKQELISRTLDRFPNLSFPMSSEVVIFLLKTMLHIANTSEKILFERKIGITTKKWTRFEDKFAKIIKEKNETIVFGKEKNETIVFGKENQFRIWLKGKTGEKLIGKGDTFDDALDASVGRTSRTSIKENIKRICVKRRGIQYEQKTVHEKLFNPLFCCFPI